MALYIPHSIFHLARLLHVRPETFGPYYVHLCRVPAAMRKDFRVFSQPLQVIVEMPVHFFPQLILLHWTLYSLNY
jgi:hypothetical protein